MWPGHERARRFARRAPPRAGYGAAGTMQSLDDFARYPLHVRPLAGPPARAADEAPRRRARSGPSATTATRGLAFGGNKTRKLEYLVADALAKGCDTLVSIGGVQSNHTRQVAAVAAHLGLGCVLVQESWVDWPDVVYDRVGNILLSRIMGADVRLVKAGFGIGFKESWEQALARRRGGAAASPTRSRPAPPTIRSAASASPRWAREVDAAGARARRLLRHDHRLLRHRLDAGRHDRRLRAARTRPRRVHRHRRLGEARRDARAGRAHRAATRRR